MKSRDGALPMYPVCMGARYFLASYFLGQAEQDAAPDAAPELLLARRAVADMVKANTVGVRQELSSLDGRLVYVWSAAALIEAVWQHVATWALEVEAGGELRRCKECQRLFLVTDKRQEYCPPFPSAEKRKRGLSTCGYVARKKRQRQRGG
jgi:hypothetical protein